MAFDARSAGVGAKLNSAIGAAAVVRSALPAAETASVSRGSRRFFSFSPGLLDQKDLLANALFSRREGSSD